MSFGRGENFDYIKMACDNWYAEVDTGKYNFQTGQSENGREINHFTQMIWRTSLKIGCAKAYKT